MKPNSSSLRFLSACAFLLSLALKSVSAAAATCSGLSFTTNSVVGFNSSSAQTVALNTSRQNNNAGCSYFYTFSRGLSPSYSRALYNSGYTLSYQLYVKFPYANILEDIPEATQNNIVANSFSAKSGPTLNQDSYRAVLASVSYPPFGLYCDSVTISLYSGSLSSHSLAQQANVSLCYYSQRQIDVSLVQKGGAFNVNASSLALDFGVLTVNATQTFDLVIMNNVGFTISLASANGGYLIQSGGRSKILYSTTVNGQAANLAAGGAQVASGSLSVPAVPVRFPVTITIGDPSKALAGTYTDAMTVTVTASQ